MAHCETAVDSRSSGRPISPIPLAEKEPGPEGEDLIARSSDTLDMTLFSVFSVTRQTFYRSPLSAAIVNLKPLVPGHVLVISRRVVPRLSDLTGDEVSDLFRTVQRVGNIIEKVYKAEALTVSVQDGLAAGQSVPHVHVHILPRGSTGPFSVDKDSMYPALEDSELGLKGDLERKESGERKGLRKFPELKDEDRAPRTEDEMEKEAEWLKSFFQ